GDGTLYLDSGWSQAEFDPATIVPAVELDFDLVNGELSLAGVAIEATLDQRAFPFEVRGGNTYFDLSGVTLGVAHTFIVTTDERTVYSLYVVDSRPAYWEIEDGQVSWERHSATGLSLSACLYANDVQSVTLQDNAVTSYHVETSGGLRHLVVELGADTLNALPASNYNLVLNYVGQQPGQITAQVTLTNSPFVLGKTEYNYGGGDLTVSIATHGDTIVGLRIGSVNYSDGFTQGVNSLVISSTVLQGREGEVTIKILSELVPSGRTITVAIGSSDLALSQVEYVYDKYDGGNLALQGYLFNEVTLYGGGITASDYTQAVGSNGVTLLAAYLNGLPQGEYRFLSKGVEVDTYFGVTVLDSGASPTNVKLNYDIDDTVAYVTFTCECGGTDHAVVVDGHTVGNGNRLAVSGVDRALQHTVVVSCGTNFKQTSLTVMAPPLAAYDYLNTHFDMDGNTSDLYVDSQEELNAVVKWLSYGGNYDSTQGTYGASSAEMYLSPRFSDGFNLNAALTEATNSFDVPFSSQVGLSMMGNKLTVTITFNSPLIRTTTSGQPYTVSADNRAYLAPAQGSGRGLYIDTVTATQKVLNVVQLADLPMGVRPIFDSSVNSQRAKAVYDAAKVVCDEYLADSMNLYQKVTALYEYLALNVTYDHYTLVWYNLYAYAMSGYYSLSEVKTKTETERLKYTDDPTMSANFARVLACDTLADARAVLDDILHSLT
ncbi:MAG: hypothetical protein J5755_05305, partial [Clostridia bacterium]|nr:hypothetical protein [Clostridia bacterium]